jgi:hypothetical protein
MSIAFTENVWVVIDDEDVEVIMRGNVMEGLPGRLTGPMENCYPPEPPEMEYWCKWASTGKDLTDDEIEKHVTPQIDEDEMCSKIIEQHYDHE